MARCSQASSAFGLAGLGRGESAQACNEVMTWMVFFDSYCEGSQARSGKNKMGRVKLGDHCQGQYFPIMDQVASEDIWQFAPISFLNFQCIFSCLETLVSVHFPFRRWIRYFSISFRLPSWLSVLEMLALLGELNVRMHVCSFSIEPSSSSSSSSIVSANAVFQCSWSICLLLMV